mgnify:CR=1 FL=1
MTLTLEQYKANEKWLLNTLSQIKPNGFFMWQDYGELFVVNDNKKFVCKNDKQYELLSNNVRPIFMTIAVVKDF